MKPKLSERHTVLNPEKRIHILSSPTLAPWAMGGFTFDDSEILHRGLSSHWPLALKRLLSQLPDVIGCFSSLVKDYYERRLAFTLGVIGVARDSKSPIGFAL